MLRRGLRLKSGLDCGDVLARVHATTGRMTYRGRVMNRSARIAGMATAGQVSRVLGGVRGWDIFAYPSAFTYGRAQAFSLPLLPTHCPYFTLYLTPIVSAYALAIYHSPPFVSASLQPSLSSAV